MSSSHSSHRRRSLSRRSSVLSVLPINAVTQQRNPRMLKRTVSMSAKPGRSAHRRHSVASLSTALMDSVENSPVASEKQQQKAARQPGWWCDVKRGTFGGRKRRWVTVNRTCLLFFHDDQSEQAAIKANDADIAVPLMHAVIRASDATHLSITHGTLSLTVSTADASTMRALSGFIDSQCQRAVQISSLPIVDIAAAAVDARTPPRKSKKAANESEIEQDGDDDDVEEEAVPPMYSLERSVSSPASPGMIKRKLRRLTSTDTFAHHQQVPPLPASPLPPPPYTPPTSPPRARSMPPSTKCAPPTPLREIATIDEKEALVLGEQFESRAYDAHFSADHHTHFAGIDVTHTRSGTPVIVSVLLSDLEWTALVRTAEGDQLVRGPYTEIASRVLRGHSATTVFRHVTRHMLLKHIKSAKSADSPVLNSALLRYEAAHTQRTHKFGVLWCRDRAGCDERALYANNAPIDERFGAFLELLGREVQLRGHAGYAGGLDRSAAASTGTHSVYARYAGIEVMYHVSNLLPYDARDPQQLQRKRHLGNDVVQVIYCSAGMPPRAARRAMVSSFCSNFNTVFVFVANDDEQQDAQPQHAAPRYRVCLEEKEGSGAVMMLPAMWRSFAGEAGSNGEFHRVLLAALINAERVALSNVAVFREKRTRTRRMLLHDIITNHL